MEQQNVPQQYTNDQPPAPLLPTSGLAVASLITGILGFTMLPVIGGIIDLVTGYMARKETRSAPPSASGDGMATAGIIMGYVELGLAVVGVCCFVAYMVLVVGIARSSYR